MACRRGGRRSGCPVRRGTRPTSSGRAGRPISCGSQCLQLALQLGEGDRLPRGRDNGADGARLAREAHAAATAPGSPARRPGRWRGARRRRRPAPRSGPRCPPRRARRCRACPNLCSSTAIRRAKSCSAGVPGRAGLARGGSYCTIGCGGAGCSEGSGVDFSAGATCGATPRKRAPASHWESR